MADETTPWSPWRHLRDNWPQITVYEYDLPAGVLGCTNYIDAIWIDYRLNQAERRCTLAHELVHLERGPAPSDPAALAIEEAVVDCIAARRLVRIGDLARAFAWSRHFAEMADELWVDERTLRSRFRGLTDDEQDVLMGILLRLDEAA